MNKKQFYGIVGKDYKTHGKYHGHMPINTGSKIIKKLLYSTDIDMVTISIRRYSDNKLFSYSGKKMLLRKPIVKHFGNRQFVQKYIYEIKPFKK